MLILLLSIYLVRNYLTDKHILECLKIRGRLLYLIKFGLIFIVIHLIQNKLIFHLYQHKSWAVYFETNIP